MVSLYITIRILFVIEGEIQIIQSMTGMQGSCDPYGHRSHDVHDPNLGRSGPILKDRMFQQSFRDFRYYRHHLQKHRWNERLSDTFVVVFPVALYAVIL